MLITNQKSILNTHAEKRKESKSNTKDSHQIKRRKKEQINYENNQKTITKQQ